MNLLRLLPGGTEAKLLVDNAIDSCTPIGNVRDDIYRCRALSEEPFAGCLVHALVRAGLSRACMDHPPGSRAVFMA